MGYNTFMNKEKLIQMLRITSKYYIQQKNQKDIAAEEGLSVPTVSRLLNRAMDSGYVNISIDYSFLSEDELARELQKIYGIKHVTMIPVIIPEPDAVLLDTCKAAASLIEQKLTSNMTVGTAWGNTMKCLASCIGKMDVENVRIIQINGRSADVAATKGTDAMVNALIEATGGDGYTIPAPVVVDDAQMAAMLKEDSGIKNALDIAKHCDMAIFSVGKMSKESIMSKSGFLENGMYEHLMEKGAVGDIASGYFDYEGNIVDQELAKRRISLSLEKLRGVPNKICVASGKDKAKVLHGAIKGNFVDYLIADEELGRALLNMK